MTTKKKGVFFLPILAGLLILLFLALFLKASLKPRPAPFLENLCLPEDKISPFSPGELQAPVQPNGRRRYQQPELNFAFEVPGQKWFARQNIIQEFEEQLAFPKIKYSLYFSYPVDSVNSFHWEEGQEAALHLMVFDHFCQEPQGWLDLIPGIEKAQKEEVEVNGQKAWRLKNLRGYQADELIVFNHGPFHYQFRLQVRKSEDFPILSEALDQIIKTFEFINLSGEDEI